MPPKSEEEERLEDQRRVSVWISCLDAGPQLPTDSTSHASPQARPGWMPPGTSPDKAVKSYLAGAPHPPDREGEKE
jgi:hypothetical protein